MWVLVDFSHYGRWINLALVGKSGIGLWTRIRNEDVKPDKKGAIHMMAVSGGLGIWTTLMSFTWPLVELSSETQGLDKGDSWKNDPGLST